MLVGSGVFGFFSAAKQAADAAADRLVSRVVAGRFGCEKITCHNGAGGGTGEGQGKQGGGKERFHCFVFFKAASCDGC
jgi:hypothetical protein